MDRLNLCLTLTYFQYRETVCSVCHGTTMDSPVSVVIADYCYTKHWETSPSHLHVTIPLWLGYVNDTFSAVHKDESEDFHEHL